MLTSRFNDICNRVVILSRKQCLSKSQANWTAHNEKSRWRRRKLMSSIQLHRSRPFQFNSMLVCLPNYNTHWQTICICIEQFKYKHTLSGELVVCLLQYCSSPNVIIIIIIIIDVLWRNSSSSSKISTFVQKWTKPLERTTFVLPKTFLFQATSDNELNRNQNPVSYSTQWKSMKPSWSFMEEISLFVGVDLFHDDDLDEPPCFNKSLRKLTFDFVSECFCGHFCVRSIRSFAELLADIFHFVHLAAP